MKRFVVLSAVGLALLVFILPATADTLVTYTAEQEYLFNVFRARRTVRSFKSDPVPREHVIRILEAACTAPTSGNQQPWMFLVIEDRHKLDRLKREALEWYVQSLQSESEGDSARIERVRTMLPPILERVLSAPVYVAVLVDSHAPYPDDIAYDGALAAGYLMIAARALGYGTGFFTSYFPESHMKRFFEIPDRYKLICFTPIGVPEEWPTSKPKKSVAEVTVFEHF